MTGSVIAINVSRGMVAVTTDNGFSIIELDGDSLDIGDDLEWEPAMAALHWKVKNVTKQRSMRVIFQNHAVPLAQLLPQLLYSEAEGHKLFMPRSLAKELGLQPVA